MSARKQQGDVEVAKFARIQCLNSREFSYKTSNLRCRRLPRKNRRGMAVVLVLGMLAITLALSYSMLRGQATTADLQRNFSRGVDARYAAQAGLAAALRKMHEANWAGINTPLHAQIDDHTWYDVTFTTGDASLTSSSPDWKEYPFRVTIRVTGSAEDDDQPGVPSRHTLESVVQLSRRALYAAPSGWSALQPYSLIQWSTDDVPLELPFRAEGNVALLGRVELAEDYPPSTQRNRYFSDLNLMRIAGLGDHRPFGGGTVTLNYGRQPSGLLTSLQSQLGLTTVNTSASSSQPVSPPASFNSYLLYPGGKTYSVPTLQSKYGLIMQNAALGPEQLENPLGIYRSDNWMSLGDNAKITGTVVSENAGSDLIVFGDGVEVKGYSLPPLEGSSEAVQLPALLVRDDLRIWDQTSAAIQGLTVVWDETSISAGTTDTWFNLTGKLLTNNFSIGSREEWDYLSDGQWNSSLVQFANQLSPLGPSTVRYYPQWVQSRQNLAYSPRLTVKPNSDGVRYHWHDWSQPIYVKGSGDAGLRWNVISQRSVE